MQVCCSASSLNSLSVSLPRPFLFPNKTLMGTPPPPPSLMSLPLTSLVAASSPPASCVSRFFERFGKNSQLRECWRRSFPDSDGRKLSAVPVESAIVKKREVVEHIILLKAKGDLSDDDEQDMLDFLYTSQYHMSGILAISLGRIIEPNADGFTHGVYMRFQRKEDLAKFYQNSLYKKVLEEHVLPHCHGLVSLGYESEVEDDILPIFRRGEDFEYGVEFLLLISVSKTARAEDVEDAFGALVALIEAFSSLIVQSTQGSNFNANDGQYTHGAVIRFPSSEAFEEFCGSSEYADMWMKKFKTITEKSLAVHFIIDPVGTQIL